MTKKNKVAVIKDPNCLNCGFPFTREERFCPECGQKNKGKKITFKSFIQEIFAGFFSWDAKFWKTIIPLLISPGKVSKDYIEGKRARYTNPFRFYLTVSILFFISLGIINTYQSFTDLNNDEAPKKISFTEATEKLTQQELDSINNALKTELSETFKNVDSTTKKQLTNLLPDLDSSNVKKTNKNPININIGISSISKMRKFQKRKPLTSTQTALDSLQIEKTFFNKFLYTRCSVINSWESNPSIFLKQAISYASIALFILLPIFTLFIKFVYIRRKFTYVEHLVFVFHTQTIFFILLTLFMFIYTINNNSNAFLIFGLAFLIYLFLAMKKFYQQGYIKTFIKYCFVNFVFVNLASFGVVGIMFAAFLFS
ncbi:DUF3667 domain-containing protein [Tenacibaculum crassostreae]|uniref:DUF3667 domain-containing protein n=1 Tax=Tenacibaculum crassostreae TaxID=502683 RepID=UPI003893105C